MSKKLIAGLGTVTALGIAALPLVGVFAADNDTDETIVRVRVQTSVECTSSDGTYDDFVYLGSVAPGTLATGDFTVSGSTNAAAGFTITGTPSALNKGTLANITDEETQRGVWTDFTADTGTAADSMAYATAAADDSWWVTTEEQSGVAIGNTIVLTGAGGAEQSFDLTANARPGLGSQPGLYQGRIQWVCAVTQ